MKTFKHVSIKRLLVVAGVATAVPLTALAFQGHGDKGGACDREGGMRPVGMKHEGGPMPLLRGLHRLDLSEAQDDKIFDIMHNQAPQMRKQMKALQKSEKDLQALKQAPDYSDAKAKGLIEQISRQRADMELARLQAERKVLEVLTPEQRKELASMVPPQSRDGRGTDRAPKGGRDGGPDRMPERGPDDARNPRS